MTNIIEKKKVTRRGEEVNFHHILDVQIDVSTWDVTVKVGASKTPDSPILQEYTYKITHFTEWSENNLERVDLLIQDLPEWEADASPYTIEQLVSRENPPGEKFVWSEKTRAWVDMRTLDDAKAQAWERIKRHRAEEELKPFECAGRVYDADRERISGAVQLAMMTKAAGQPFGLNWTLADNSTVALTAGEMIEVGATLGARTSAIFDIARELREQIAQSTSNAEADAILWNIE